MHIAKAYGVKPSPAKGSVQGRSGSLPAVQPSSAPRQVEGGDTSRAVDSLVAGKVESASPGTTINALLDASTAPPAASGFSLYTRAADKVEAAIGVAMGKMVDVKG